MVILGSFNEEKVVGVSCLI